MKYSLAVCYLTHNHPDIVKQVLENALEDYAAHDIDICFYDDSDDEASKQMIEDYINKGAKNLFYVDIHGVAHGDEKMYRILHKEGLPKEYDYIWPSKDRTYFSGSLLDRLCAIVDEGPDVIQIADENKRWDLSHPIFTDEYHDAAEFYRNYDAFTTNWEGTIRRIRTMLDPIDWDRYEADYHVNGGFLQGATVYVRLSEMQDFTVKICRYSEDERCLCVNKGSSDWKRVMAQTWIDNWTKANFHLPSIYDKYKMEAIKSQTGKVELYGSVESLIGYHQQGIYTKDDFEKYRSMWPMITDIPVECMELVASGKYDDAIKLTFADFINRLKEHDYIGAFRIIAGNYWMESAFDKQTYNVLLTCFSAFKRDMLFVGESQVFDGVSSVEDVVNKYR